MYSGSFRTLVRAVNLQAKKKRENLNKKNTNKITRAAPPPRGQVQIKTKKMRKTNRKQQNKNKTEGRALGKKNKKKKSANKNTTKIKTCDAEDHIRTLQVQPVFACVFASHFLHPNRPLRPPPPPAFLSCAPPPTHCTLPDDADIRHGVTAASRQAS